MSHTEGKLTAQGLRLYIGSACIADLSCTVLSLRENEGIARRLVACWNACEGLDTFYLEQTSIKGLHDSHHAQANEWESLVQECVEVLAVLRDVESELNSVLGIVKPATRSRIAAILAKHKGEV